MVNLEMALKKMGPDQERTFNVFDDANRDMDLSGENSRKVIRVCTSRAPARLHKVHSGQQSVCRSTLARPLISSSAQLDSEAGRPKWFPGLSRFWSQDQRGEKIGHDLGSGWTPNPAVQGSIPWWPANADVAPRRSNCFVSSRAGFDSQRRLEMRMELVWESVGLPSQRLRVRSPSSA